MEQLIRLYDELKKLKQQNGLSEVIVGPCIWNIHLLDFIKANKVR